MKMILIEECTNCKEDVQFKVDVDKVQDDDLGWESNIRLIIDKHETSVSTCKNCNTKNKLYV